MTTTAVRRRVVLCADDFGLTEAASNSIVQLAGIAAISAASCVVDAPGFSRHVAALASCRSGVAIGLHLNLTEGTPSPLCRALPSWVARAYSNRVPPQSALRAEIARQLDVFENALNSAPCFVDGHQHVHQLPHIGDALIDELIRRYGANVAVRSTVSMKPRGLKARVIAQLGGTALRAMLAARRLPTNSDFAGVYNFSSTRPFNQRMKNWLWALTDGGLIMCHPERDTVPAGRRTARHVEHDFLASQAWTDMCRALNITLIPFRVEAHCGTAPFESVPALPRAPSL